MSLAMFRSIALAAVVLGGALPLAAQAPVNTRVGIAPIANELVLSSPTPGRSLLPDSAARDYRNAGALMGGGLFLGSSVYVLGLSCHLHRCRTNVSGLATAAASVAFVTAIGAGIGAVIGSFISKE